MVKILLSGCNGKMGRVISACVRERGDCKIIGGVDLCTETPFDYPVYASFDGLNLSADVLIDFSHVSVLTPLLTYAVKEKIPAVLCSTGYSDLQVEEIHRAAEILPVFYSRNMSMGINLLLELAKKAAAVLGSQFDVEIIEKHHNLKIDAPSGTALMLADAVSEALPEPVMYEYNRHAQRKKRGKNEIGIHAVRGGTIVGEHEVLFAGHDEIISLTHIAQSKEVFATGSVNAAVYLAACSAPGLYDMGNLLAAAD